MANCWQKWTKWTKLKIDNIYILFEKLVVSLMDIQKWFLTI